ncbi:PTS sugar transporter subunit IIA [Brevibacterium litoralis]|uniref:PTS sugar transporter subunit IIA n=1 Tax=Brevibacterium litoralis TaxID=3138935 RepID=UPI0032EBEFE1
MSVLSELLGPESVALDVPAAGWAAAITAAGSLLVSGGIAGESYTQKMIDNVTENGPYIVIAPGFAFAHARPDESVTRTGMSLVRLAAPVEFGHAKNDPVTLALAAVDDTAHRKALAALAKVLADKEKKAALDAAATPEDLLAVFEPAVPAPQDTAPAASPGTAPADPGTGESGGQGASAAGYSGPVVASKNFVYTVCGNGLGTSLFLKNTLEQVFERWGWGKYVTVEATDTISARGKAGDADFVLTSGEIAKTLGDVGVPVEVIEDFTSQAEIDAALRRLYAL